MQPAAPTGVVVSIVAFAIGIILLIIAAKTASPFAAIPGFVGVATPLLYWNTLFWSWAWRNKNSW